MRVLIFIITQVMGFLITRNTNTISFTKYTHSNIRVLRAVDESPQWMIEGGDTSETECSSSGDIKRAAAAAKAKAEAELLAAKLLAEEKERKAAEEEKRLALAMEAAAAAEASKKVAVVPAAAVQSATVEAPKVDLTKLSVGTDSFDVGLLIAFPIIVATLGFFFLFPLIGPQLAATLPPVPKM